MAAVQAVRWLLWAGLCVGMGGCLARPVGVQASDPRFVAPTAVVRVAWSKQLVRGVPLLQYKPQEFATAAVGVEGLLYIGSSAKKFYALRPRDGAEIWVHELTGAVASEPLYLQAGQAGADPLVIIGDDDGALTALDARTGKQRWVYRVRGTIRVRPSYHEGVVYFTSGDGRLYAVDAKTGAWRWQYEREVPESFSIRGASGALVSGSRVFCGFPDGYLVALNAATGEVGWARQLSGDATRFTDVDSTPVLHGDVLYASSYSGGVYALDVKDGSTRWRYELDGAGPLSLDAANGRLYVAAAEIGLSCLDLQGHFIWRQALGQQGELTTPTVWGDYVLFSAADGGAYIVEARSGQLLQFFDPGHGVTGRPVAQGGRVYVLSNAGVFYALTTG